jgi:GT2 family glycosyltransferase
MISIITAVHNGLAFNKIYLEYLRRYTTNPFELIIIDNASEDGTRAYFESQPDCRVIANAENFSYPYCQNQGIRMAKGDYLFFLNNDLIVSPHWDERLLEAARRHGLDVISGAGIENLGIKEETQAIGRKWKRVKNPLTLLGFGGSNLRRMHRLMYWNWERFCENRFRRFGYEVVEGIVGNNVMMTRRAADLLGGWDERIQSADFDLFMRVKQRSLQQGDIQPPHIAKGVYIHHYIRLTSKYAVKPKPFADKDRLIKLTEKWTPTDVEALHPDNETLRKP